MNNNSLWSDALYRLTRNKAAMLGGFILILLIICAILAPWIAPYSYSYQDLNLGASPPSGEHLLGTDILGRDVNADSKQSTLLYIYDDGSIEKKYILK